jgi:hypothetical protein
MIDHELIPSVKKRMLCHEVQRWVGVTEVGGDNSGQIVEMFQKSVDGKAQREAWCLSFIFFCIQEVDKLANSIFLQSLHPTLLKPTKHCMTLFRASKPQILKTPEVGSIMLWEYVRNGKPTDQGHAEVVLEVHQDHVVTVGGNTSDGQQVNRDGDGVYKRVRSVLGSPTMVVRGYLRVW